MPPPPPRPLDGLRSAESLAARSSSRRVASPPSIAQKYCAWICQSLNVIQPADRRTEWEDCRTAGGGWGVRTWVVVCGGVPGGEGVADDQLRHDLVEDVVMHLREQQRPAPLRWGPWPGHAASARERGTHLEAGVAGIAAAARAVRVEVRVAPDEEDALVRVPLRPGLVGGHRVLVLDPPRV